MTDNIFPCRTETEDSASLFHELRRRVSATLGGRHAVLALDTLGELMISKSRRETPALTWSILEPLIVPLGDLAQRYEGECWCDLVLSLLDLVPVPTRKPALVLQLALYAPEEVRPVLLAEYWHLLMIGARHDRLFALSVALDVWGHALSTPSKCLTKTLVAAAQRVPTGSPWAIASTEPPDRSPESTLRAVASIPREFDFIRGWWLVHLSSWLTEVGLGEETRKLAQRLSRRFGARDDTLERLKAEAGRPAQPGDRGSIHIPNLPGGFGDLNSQSCAGSTVRRSYVGGEGEDRKRKFPVYLGRPGQGYHPLHFQNVWIQAQYGVAIDLATMSAFQAL